MSTLTVSRESTPARVVRSFWVFAVIAAGVAAQSPAPFGRVEGPIPDTGFVLGFGDVDGDGFPDMIVAGPPFVLRNDGSGRFTPLAGSGGYSGATPVVHAIADLTGDGR